MTEKAPNGNGYARIGVWASAISAGALVIGAFIWIGTIASQVSGNMEKTNALDERMNRVSNIIQSLQLSEAENCRQLSTVEVQMATVETIINKTQVANQRDISLLWNKSFAQQYPDTFYAVSIPHEAMPCLH